MDALGSREFPTELATRIIARVIARHGHKIRCFPEYSETAAIESLCLNGPNGDNGLMAAWPTFDHSKPKALTTWMYRIAFNKIADAGRVLRRRSGHETAYHLELAHNLTPERSPEEVLAEAETLYQAARVNLKAIPPREPFANKGTPTKAQAATVTALQRRLGYSCRAMAHYLEEHPELRATIGLKRTPDRMGICRMNAAVTRLGGILRRSQRRGMAG